MCACALPSFHRISPDFTRACVQSTCHTHTHTYIHSLSLSFSLSLPCFRLSSHGRDVLRSYSHLRVVVFLSTFFSFLIIFLLWSLSRHSSVWNELFAVVSSAHLCLDGICTKFCCCFIVVCLVGFLLGRGEVGERHSFLSSRCSIDSSVCYDCILPCCVDTYECSIPSSHLAVLPCGDTPSRIQYVNIVFSWTIAGTI